MKKLCIGRANLYQIELTQEPYICEVFSDKCFVTQSTYCGLKRNTFHHHCCSLKKKAADGRQKPLKSKASAQLVSANIRKKKSALNHLPPKTTTIGVIKTATHQDLPVCFPSRKTCAQ